MESNELDPQMILGMNILPLQFDQKLGNSLSTAETITGMLDYRVVNPKYIRKTVFCE